MNLFDSLSISGSALLAERERSEVIAANMAGLADGISIPVAKAAGFWVFAAFIPILAIGLRSAWKFTAAEARP